MPQAFQARKFFIPKTDPKQEVYKPVPYYFGTLSTQGCGRPDREESSLTKGDVLNVWIVISGMSSRTYRKVTRWSC